MTKETDFPQLQTARLVLRKPTKDDANAVLFLRSDTIVNQYVKRGQTKSIEEAVQFISKIDQGYLDKANIYWSINLKDNPEMIGSICLWDFSKDRKQAEIGYDLSPQFYNQGIMTEAIATVINYGFKTLQLEVIEAYTSYKNEASIRILQKNNFKLIPDKKDSDNPDNRVFGIENNNK